MKKTNKPVRLFNIYGDNRGTGFSGNVWDINGISPTLTTMGGGNREPMIVKSINNNNMKQKHKLKLPKELEGKKFRIRKLTPRECFRLMGVDDKDIDKIQAAGISNSSQYKLAGNSIVVDVLYHLFRKMFVETEQENSQLTLF